MNGIINVIKPPGMSSSCVVVYLKGILGQKKVGHAGTLDPGAAGVLPVLAGRATKLSDYLMNMGKEYIAEITFGISTDTLDSYGTITETSETIIDKSDFINELAKYTGEIYQTPPAFSAVKINGVASYKLARNGNVRIKPERLVTVYSNEYLGSTGINRFLFKIKCSKGTYIRVIASDIGKALNVPAHLSFLLRTSAGGLNIDNAYTLDEIKNMKESGDFSFVLPTDCVSFGYSEIRLSDRDIAKIINGLVIHHEEKNGYYMVYSDKNFIGIGEIIDKELKLKISLYDQEQ